MIRVLIALAVSFFFGVSHASAQSSVSTADRTAITGVWNDIVAAVRSKDRRALESIYAEDFVHVHAIGKVDDRKSRLDVLLSGEATVDTAAAVEVGLRKYGEVIVAVGNVNMVNTDGQKASYAVTRIYAKQDGRWRFASSHASPITVN